jgi:pimeloyl-ACP methyl ester carboxylesterase
VTASSAPDGTAQHLPGLDLHYHTWGTPDPARAVLLIHGLTNNHKVWALLGPKLAEAGFYVIAPDLRGRGLSDKPAHGYGVPFHAADLASLLDALGIREADVVGHSLGSFIAMLMAVVQTTYVRKLVLVDAGGVVPADTAQAIGASVARLGTVFPSLDAYLSQMRQLPMIPEWTPFWEDYFRYDALEREDGTVVSRVPKAAIDEENLTNYLIRIDVLPSLIRKPTLIMRATVGLLGPDRGLLLPREEAERMLGLIPGSRLVEVAGTNHYTIGTVPEFAMSVREFLTASE